MPVTGFAGELPAPRGGEGVVLRAAVVLRWPPLRLDEPLLLQLEERGVQGAVIERQAVLARLLDAARDAVTVQGAEHVEGPQNHQRERALLHVQFVRHDIFLWDTYMTITSHPRSGNGRLGPRGAVEADGRARVRDLTH